MKAKQLNGFLLSIIFICMTACGGGSSGNGSSYTCSNFYEVESALENAENGDTIIPAYELTESDIDYIRDALKETIKDIILDLSDTGLERISDSAFYNTTKLVGIILPESVTMIGASAFVGCSGLKEIIIPSKVEIIGMSAFQECTSLEKVVFAEPSSLLSIGSYAFYKCSSLDNISIPASVTGIGTTAFGMCGKLAMITVLRAESPITSLGANCFDGCGSLSQISVPQSVLEEYKNATNWLAYKTLMN